MMRRRMVPAPLPQYRRVPVPPSFWDDPAFGSHEPMKSSTGSWECVGDKAGEHQ